MRPRSVPPPSAYDIETKLILNAGTKEAVVWYNISDTVTGTSSRNCSKVIFDKLPSLDHLSELFRHVILPHVQAAAWCDGEDDALDSWRFSGSHPIPPGTLPAQMVLDAL